MPQNTASSVSTRKYLIADPHVQGAIVKRVMIYAFAATLYYAVILFFSVYFTPSDTTVADRFLRCVDDAISWLPGLLVLGPIAAYDLFSVTNRFAGPICRLRRELKMLVDDSSAGPLTFRKEDHWSEIAVLFNQLRDELTTLRAEAAAQQEAAQSQAVAAEIEAEAEEILI